MECYGCTHLMMSILPAKGGLFGVASSLRMISGETRKEQKFRPFLKPYVRDLSPKNVEADMACSMTRTRRMTGTGTVSSLDGFA
eukprot:scaffold918_cov126-Cylindrotheca_fusiformis.AAC.79